MVLLGIHGDTVFVYCHEHVIKRIYGFLNQSITEYVALQIKYTIVPSRNAQHNLIQKLSEIPHAKMLNIIAMTSFIY